VLAGRGAGDENAQHGTSSRRTVYPSLVGAGPKDLHLGVGADTGRLGELRTDLLGGNPELLRNLAISRLRAVAGSRLCSAGGQETQRKPADQNGHKGQMG
jgi:hypothetical protein